eukprot:3340966-Amphidinium_carterae.1
MSDISRQSHGDGSTYQNVVTASWVNGEGCVQVNSSMRLHEILNLETMTFTRGPSLSTPRSGLRMKPCPSDHHSNAVDPTPSLPFPLQYGV